jgi:hypothetical protein
MGAAEMSKGRRTTGSDPFSQSFPSAIRFAKQFTLYIQRIWHKRNSKEHYETNNHIMRSSSSESGALFAIRAGQAKKTRRSNHSQI